MDFIDIPQVVCDVFFGIWLAIQQIYDTFGLGTKIVVTIIFILFLGYLLLDVIYCIVDVMRRFLKIINGEDPNA